MHRIPWVVSAVFLAALVPACGGNGDNAAPETISAIDLHKAFMADAKAAEQRWSGRRLLITGEVAITTERTSGWTMRGEVQVPARIYLRTEIEDRKSDIPYVVCEGDLDEPPPGGGFRLNPGIAVGRPVTVECRMEKLRWSSPGLYLLDCPLARPAGS